MYHMKLGLLCLLLLCLVVHIYIDRIVFYGCVCLKGILFIGIGLQYTIGERPKVPHVHRIYRRIAPMTF